MMQSNKYVFDCGRKPEYPERTHAFTGNFIQKGLIELVELNQGPSCCEGTVLTPEAPRYHGSKFCRMFPVHMGICRMEIWMKDQ